MKRLLLVFQSTREALRAERALRAGGIGCSVIPVPRSISSECGIAIEVSPVNRTNAEAVCSRECLKVSFFVWEKTS